MKRLLLSAGLLTALAGAQAQDGTFTIDGQYRPRFELRNGFKRPIGEYTEAAAFIEQRTRLTLGYKSEKFGAKTSIQDIRVWGETGQINKSDQLLSTHEAYGEYYMSPKSTIRIGRQEMAYDGHRFIGTLGWAAQARAFDAVKYMFKDTLGNQFDAFVSWNQDGATIGAPEPAKLTSTTYSQTGGKNTATLFNLPLPKAQIFAYYKKTFSSGDIALMINDDVLQNPVTTYHRYTIGLTPNFKAGKMKFGGQFYYTGGQQSQFVDYSSFMFNAYVQYTGSIKPMLGVDFLSGDNSDATTNSAWVPIYGTNHKFYGWMDYFYVGNGHSNAGLIDIFLKTAIKTGEKSKILAHLHQFMGAVSVADPDGGTMGSGLGTELDLVYANSLTKGVTLKVGYSAMVHTETMNVIKSGVKDAGEQPFSSWGWVMIDFTPKFL